MQSALRLSGIVRFSEILCFFLPPLCLFSGYFLCLVCAPLKPYPAQQTKFPSSPQRPSQSHILPSCIFSFLYLDVSPDFPPTPACPSLCFLSKQHHLRPGAKPGHRELPLLPVPHHLICCHQVLSVLAAECSAFLSGCTLEGRGPGNRCGPCSRVALPLLRRQSTSGTG